MWITISFWVSKLLNFEEEKNRNVKITINNIKGIEGKKREQIYKR